MEKRNISIASKNGYTYEKVMKAKKYLEEIGTNRRFFPFDKLVTYYNEILGTNDSTHGCKCQSPKYYNGLQNYYTYGKLTLINNGLAEESDFEIKEEVQPIENAENRINLGTENIASEPSKDDKVEDIKEEVKEEAVEPKKGTKRTKK